MLSGEEYGTETSPSLGGRFRCDNTDFHLRLGIDPQESGC
jgi:hypothetical protein